MNLENLNRQIVTFVAAALLFLGSLYYFVNVAFKNGEFLQKKQTPPEEQLFLNEI